MRLAIVGSHVLTSHQYKSAELLIHGILRDFRVDGDLTVISGGADGVDEIAETASMNVLGTNARVYLPKHKRWEPEGYKDRNLAIARYCDELVCIRSRDSKTYGSGWTADRAEELEKLVWRYWV